MDDFLNSYVTEVVASARQNRARIEADYENYVAKLKSDYEAARSDTWRQGDLGKMPTEPIPPPAPKTVASFAPAIRANTLVARVYPTLGGIAVQGDENEGELAITITDENGEVLARYSGIRGH